MAVRAAPRTLITSVHARVDASAAPNLRFCRTFGERLFSSPSRCSTPEWSNWSFLWRSSGTPRVPLPTFWLCRSSVAPVALLSPSTAACGVTSPSLSARCSLCTGVVQQRRAQRCVPQRLPVRVQSPFQVPAGVSSAQTIWARCTLDSVVRRTRRNFLGRSTSVWPMIRRHFDGTTVSHTVRGSKQAVAVMWRIIECNLTRCAGCGEGLGEQWQAVIQGRSSGSGGSRIHWVDCNWFGEEPKGVGGVQPSPLVLGAAEG